MDTEGKMARSWQAIAVAAVVSGLLASVVSILLGWDPPDADIKFDYLSAWGALYANAHDPILVLADQAGVSIEVNAPVGVKPPFVHPRTPGAVLFSIPLLLVPFRLLFALMVGLTVSVGVLLAAWVTRQGPPKDLVMALMLVGFSAPFVTTIRFAGQAGLLVFLIYIGWGLLSRERDVAAGVTIAIAGVLKVFPLLLVVPGAMMRRPRFVGALAGTVLLVNLAALALPGLDFGSTVMALTTASASWLQLRSNGSFVRVLSSVGFETLMAMGIAAFLGIGVLGYLYRTRTRALILAPSPWLVVALLTIPLSWVSYDLVLLPLALVLLSRRSRPTRLLVLMIWAFWIAPGVVLWFRVVQLGYLSFAARGLLLVAWVWSVGPRESSSSLAMEAEEADGDEHLFTQNLDFS